MQTVAVQELDNHIRQLSLSDQLWLMEKLTKRIRDNLQSNPELVENVGLGSLGDEQSLVLDANSPLYKDMQEILDKKQSNSLTFHSYKELFDE